MDECAGRASRSLLTARPPHLERFAAPRAKRELSWPIVSMRHPTHGTRPTSRVTSRAAIMVAMRRGTDTPPVLTGSLQMLAALAVVVDLALVASGAGEYLLTSFGLLVIITVGLVGLFVARGRWARRYLWVGLVIEAALFVKSGNYWLVLVAILAAGASLGLPGLDGWIRQLRRADAPPEAAVLLPLALLSVPAVLGLAVNAVPGVWVFSLASALAAWSYARAHRVTLWALRLVYPVIGTVIALGLPLWQALTLIGVTALSVVLAWTPGALRGIQPLEARRLDAKPVFAELAPPGLMDEIGRDSHGRKK